MGTKASPNDLGDAFVSIKSRVNPLLKFRNLRKTYSFLQLM